MSILIGPYIGSFAQEILIFIPYVRYILSILDDNDNVVVASHSNRKFLYDDIGVDFYPVFASISRNELCQKGLLYTEINKQQFNQITRSIKNNIGSIVDHYNIPYVKNHNQISYYQKIFNRFSYTYNKGNDIIFIPNTNNEQNREIYQYMSKYNNVSVLGDMNNGLPVYNSLLKRMDYFDIVYKEIFNAIHNSLFVITSCSEWALICNLQNIPVFYWGNDASLFKPDGMYCFGNKNIISLRDINLKMIDYFYDKMKDR